MRRIPWCPGASCSSESLRCAQPFTEYGVFRMYFPTLGPERKQQPDSFLLFVMRRSNCAGVSTRNAMPGACEGLSALCCFCCVCYCVQPLGAKLNGPPFNPLCIAKTNACMRAEQGGSQEQFGCEWRGMRADGRFPGHKQCKGYRYGLLLIIGVYLLGICSHQRIVHACRKCMPLSVFCQPAQGFYGCACGSSMQGSVLLLAGSGRVQEIDHQRNRDEGEAQLLRMHEVNESEAA